MENTERARDVARVLPVVSAADAGFPEPLAADGKAAGRAITPWKRRRPPAVIDDTRQRNLRLRDGSGRDAASEAYRLVRTQLLQRMVRHGYRTLAVVGATQGDGKTLSAINLALSIARESRYTALLVDLDLRCPSVAETLGLDVSRGLECYFDGTAPLAPLFVPVVTERLVVLPCRVPVPSPSEVLASATMQLLVEELGARYPDRIVLFDLSPMLVGDDVISFLPYVDAALVVVGDGVTRKRDVKRMFELLGDTPVVGTILNRSRHAVLKPYR